jgi:hypothetical protein
VVHPLLGAPHEDALQRAVDRNWVIVDEGTTACVTDEGQRRIMTGSQRIHVLIPDASPPPTNEAIVTSVRGHGSLIGRAMAHQRSTQKIPLNTLRSSTRRTPRGLLGSIGLIEVHSLSLSSCA